MAVSDRQHDGETKTVSKTKLYEIPWKDRSSLAAQSRMVKLLKPLCKEHHGSCKTEYCQHAGWVQRCKAAGHDPFTTRIRHAREVEEVDTQPDGREVVKGIRKEYYYDPVPRFNTVQIPLENKSASGLHVDWALANGYIRPESYDGPNVPEGYSGCAPMCEYRDCWSPNPPVNTAWGNYCSYDHSGATELRLKSIPQSQDPGGLEEQIRVRRVLAG